VTGAVEVMGRSLKEVKLMDAAPYAVASRRSNACGDAIGKGQARAAAGNVGRFPIEAKPQFRAEC